MKSLRIGCVIALLTGILVAGACNYSKEGKASTNFKFTIKVEDKNEITRQDQLIAETRYVPLETGSNSILGNIDKIEIWNDTIVISDSNNDQILTFDMSGKFLNKIGQKGRCPTCFFKIDDITIDRDSDLICILDTHQHKILKYSLSGVFKSSGPVPDIFPIGFTYNKGYTFFNMHRSPTFYKGRILYNDVFVTKDGQVVTEYFPFNKDVHSALTLSQIFYRLGDTLNFIRFREGEVYAIAEDGASGRFNIDFGEDKLPFEYMQIGGDPTQASFKPYSYLFNRLVENSNYVYFTYIKKQRVEFGIFSKEDNLFYNLRPREFALALFQPIYNYHDAFVSAVEPAFFTSFVKNGAKSDDSLLVQWSKTIKDNDNRVLLFHYTK